jgi:homopolymeric O-antigen transport system ATP-binding protein
MLEPFIEVRNATLRYPAGPRVSRSLKGTIFNLLGRGEIIPSRSYITAFEALSFSVATGDRLGVIGRNGAGKSSLLRALAGIYPLYEGRIHIRGQVQTMFETGLGFESEATGRENITYRGLVLGLDPSAIASREQEIINFADIGEFIDLPMRMYSTGMWARLAFAISAFLHGNILLIDEVFATGDAQFQSHAIRRMQEIVERAGIVVFVSHDMPLIESFCTRVLWLDHGKIVMDGPPDEIIDAYLASIR